MMRIKPAFPIVLGGALAAPGITSRELFAAFAMTALLREPDLSFKDIAVEAFLMADAMVEQSERSSSE
jgi:hypothetical protein